MDRLSDMAVDPRTSTWTVTGLKLACGASEGASSVDVVAEYARVSQTPVFGRLQMKSASDPLFEDATELKNQASPPSPAMDS